MLVSDVRRWLPSRGALAWLTELPTAALVAGGVLVIHFLVAVTGPLWAPYSPTQSLVGPPLAPPSAHYLFGTDNLGRDVFSRVVHGERTVLTLALSATGLAVILGATLGIVMGYVRGWLDETVMRVVDILISIPPLILALLILGSLGSSPPLLILTVAFFYTPRIARVVRAATLDVVTEDFVAIAKARGESAWSIALRELLPNVVGTVFVEFAIRSGYAVIFIGSLGFLGFGAPPPAPEWGLMINEGRDHIFVSPWPVLAPSLGIATLVVALNLFTEGIARVLGRSVSRKPQG
jgi:peptide/nickel transport system permease protein